MDRNTTRILRTVKLGEVRREWESLNNTHVWEANGRLFANSLKYPEVFARILTELRIDLDQVDFCIHFRPTEAEYPGVTYGEAVSGIQCGGRKTICNVVSIDLTMPYIRTK